MNLNAYCFTKEWTLFLDRDGVINRRIPGGYVTRWEDFVFLEGVPEAIGRLSEIFGTLIIVSNQQGVGKGLMSDHDLQLIDSTMKDAISRAGGRIDAAYYSPHLESTGHPDRKPGIGMAIKAKADFPHIDFEKCIMIGDSPSDMEFGKKMGMVNVLIGKEDDGSGMADFRFDSLLSFAKAIEEMK